MLVRVILRLRSLVQRAQKGGARKSRKLKIWAAIQKPIKFGIGFAVIWVGVFAYRIPSFINAFLYEDSAELWVQCLLTNYAGGVVDPATNCSSVTSMLDAPAAFVEGGGSCGCGELVPKHIDPALLYSLHLAVSLQPWFVFWAFGVDPVKLRAAGSASDDTGGTGAAVADSPGVGLAEVKTEMQQPPSAQSVAVATVRSTSKRLPLCERAWAGGRRTSADNPRTWRRRVVHASMPHAKCWSAFPFPLR